MFHLQASVRQQERLCLRDDRDVEEDGGISCCSLGAQSLFTHSVPSPFPFCCSHSLSHTQASGDNNKNGYAQEMIEMLKKMKASDYYLPESLGLTSECKALLHKLLHPDWTKRVKIPEIMADAWFRTDLPPDALNMNDRYIANTRSCTQSEDGEGLPRLLGWVKWRGQEQYW